MFRKKLQRCIASLMLTIILVGAISPYQVYADTNTSTASIAGFSSVEKEDISCYYPNSSPTRTTTLWKLTLDNGATEYVSWAHPTFAKSYNLSSFTMPGKDASTFQDKCYSKISSDTFTTFDEVSAKVNESLANTQGASTAVGLDSLSGRLAVFLYARLNPDTINTETDIDNISNKDYADILNKTLELGHEEDLESALERLGFIQADADTQDDIDEKGHINSNIYAYSAKYLGAFSIATSSTAGTTMSWNPSDASPVFLANDYAAHICLSEYLSFYENDMVEIYNTDNWESNETCQNKLTVIKCFNEAFSEYIPLVKTVYEHANVDAGNMSLKDMVEKAGVEDNAASDSATMGDTSSSYVAHTDTSTPIGNFYSSNSDIGIVAYERDTILADVEVNTAMDTMLQEEISEQKHEEDLTLEDDYGLTNEFITSRAQYAENVLKAYKDSDSKKIVEYFNDEHYDGVLLALRENVNDAIYTKLVSYINGEEKNGTIVKFMEKNDGIITVLEDIASQNNQDILDALDKASGFLKEGFKSLKKDKTYGVNEEGVASSLNSVTINENIIDGIGYSATFVPMRTNLYSTDTLNSFSGDEEFLEFYKKYGFMRKALYIDTSSTAAVDYYTAGGTFTGSTKVCTLRDLIESGDSDVVLYIDSNFYNAAGAIEEGNTLRDNTLKTHTKIYESLAEFQPLWGNSTIFDNCSVTLSAVSNTDVLDAVVDSFDESTTEDKVKINADTFYSNMADILAKRYKFNLDKLKNTTDMKTYVSDLAYANDSSIKTEFNERVLKTSAYTSYADSIRNLLEEIEGDEYVNIENSEDLKATDDNIDSVVLTSSQITEYMSMETKYEQTVLSKDKKTETVNTYTKISSYSPMLSLSYVSCLYRSPNLYTLANTVEVNNPVFMASDDLCGIKEANQWYRNSLLNYALLKNLKGNAQVDYSYVVDLDCPVYMDIFGNIITESGTVVIPAACNATLHAGSFKDNNYAIGLYTCYGKEYSIPLDTKGAYSVLYPYFIADLNAENFVTNAITVNIDGKSVRLDKINQYNTDVQSGVIDLYKAYVSSDGKVTRMNWMAMVKIVNEVMRGAPIENIDKDVEGLYTTSTRNKSAAIAAIKLESLIESLHGQMSNTLLCIPDFSRTDNLEVWVALLMKLMMVALSAVIIISIYRDGVSGKLGLRTFLNSLAAIALTVSCIVVVPSVFQLTYYAANKFLLADESMRILLVNEEKRQCGVEIGMTSTENAVTSDEFSIQLDWITVPWYEELETILYESTLDNLQKTKLKAYRESTIYNNTDVDLYNDGVYVSTDTLFNSVSIDYTFTATSSGDRGLYLYANDKQQTAGFYSPYYVFLRVLTANINEYNQWRGAYGDKFTSIEEVRSAMAADSTIVLDTNSYTTKYVSGNRLKTVGLCYNYFTSDTFMDDDVDIMRLYQIYGATDAEKEANDENNLKIAISAKERNTFDRALLFKNEDLEQFRTSMWYNEFSVKDLEKRVETLDAYARDFVANNADLLNKVTDETFIKVMALNMAIKYNQLFGVTSANALEIYNLDSNDLLRLCVVKPDEAVMASPMSYARFIYNFGGEAAVYAGTILTMIMWVGSFVKPLCTVIVFVSVFMSIFVFRVCLRKPSANLWGYLVTVGLLCATNILHALILKIGVNLPSFGLSTLGCLIFLIVGQVAYLLVLAYVTGVSLKDWSNLGVSEYEKEARLIKSKFKKEDTSAMLSGKVKHHDDNWDYYNDLVKQHRGRNAT